MRCPDWLVVIMCVPALAACADDSSNGGASDAAIDVAVDAAADGFAGDGFAADVAADVAPDSVQPDPGVGSDVPADPGAPTDTSTPDPDAMVVADDAASAADAGVDAADPDIGPADPGSAVGDVELDPGAADVPADPGADAPEEVAADVAPDAELEVSSGDEVDTGCAEGTPCDDGHIDTKDDHCNDVGLCVGTYFTCTPALCETASTPNGTDCDVAFAGAGTPCDDGNPGTDNDECDGGGVCAGAATGDGDCGSGENACNSWADCQNGFFPTGDSCVGSCGVVNVNGLGTCSCDTACADYNDCCFDKQAVCGC